MAFHPVSPLTQHVPLKCTHKQTSVKNEWCCIISITYIRVHGERAAQYIRHEAKEEREIGRESEQGTERERDSGREKEHKRERKQERERERERESERSREREREVEREIKSESERARGVLRFPPPAKCKPVQVKLKLFSRFFFLPLRLLRRPYANLIS